MVPQQFGRYELHELIAQGGMGQVFRAVLRSDTGFAKELALKRVLKAFCADSEFVKRFADEARIASTLNHGNIVHVFDFGEVDEEYFLAMELVNGPDLGTVLDAARAASRALPIPFALQVGSELCRGLGAAHTRTDLEGNDAPVIHRDVSPPNVLLSRGGEVKVTDFGIAKAADKALRTQTGMVLGKCRYMSPEQAAGEVVGPRADVFSAGCIVFEMLTGAPVFAGERTDQILRNVLVAPIPRASELRPEVPPEIDALLGRALARDDRDRHANGSELARALEGLLHTIAPHYCREDVAELVAELVPPRRRRGSSSAPARPAPSPADNVSSTEAFAATASARRTERGVGGPTPAAEPDPNAKTTPRGHVSPIPRGTPEQETMLLDREGRPTGPPDRGASRDGGASAEGEPFAAVSDHDPLSDPAPLPATPGSAARRLTLVALGASILGLLAGAFWPLEGGLPAPRAEASSGAWRARVSRATLHGLSGSPAARRVSVLLEIEGPDPAALPRACRLQRGSSPPVTPRAWQVPRRGEVLLIFPWAGEGGAFFLHVAPPGAAPMHLSVVPSRERDQ